MKRRKFLKFLALIPALPIACQGEWPFKPKSKPPPIDRYDPNDPETVASGSIYAPLEENENLIWNSGLGKPDTLILSPEMFKAWIDIVGKGG